VLHDRSGLLKIGERDSGQLSDDVRTELLVGDGGLQQGGGKPLVPRR
jgi:hypothetical protein